MAFWKPGTAAPGIDLDRDSEADGNQGGLPFVYNKLSNLPLHQQRVSLPIFRFSIKKIITKLSVLTHVSVLLL